MPRPIVVGGVLFAMGCSLNGEPGRTTAKSCGELETLYQNRLAAMCSLDSGYVRFSGFCEICAPAHLHSYKRNTDGTCSCQPLLIEGERCAGSVDDSQLTTAIAAADNDCLTFRLPSHDAGVDAADAGD